ncbi:hypothetical protein MLD38_034294 [Melastoma candidum]|uniref:Uncharacterized protein n=1 Tax=Melastoma candidum TaxID=119954 RepID=A0ACB9MA38_9MYRT|nr:hypothetical protein MLD38_034294 [Melastoma candidum]
MDTSPAHVSNVQEEEDEWDNDGFVIPSLGIGFSDTSERNVAQVEAFQPPSPKAKAQENIYLGPHGAPPSQLKVPILSAPTRKQHLKQKLKEADWKLAGPGRENKVENIRELLGGGRGSPSSAKGSSRDWLDPHCQESQFEKWCPQ